MPQVLPGGDRRDSLEDGAICVRGTSNARPARSGEVLALVERARGGGKPPIELEVAVLGPICRIDRVEEVLESLRDHEEENSSRAYVSTYGNAGSEWK